MGTRLEAGSGLGRQANSPADAEGEAADVGDDIVEAMVDTPPVLEVDVELGELQLDVIDVVQEEHQDAHVVVPAGEWGREGDVGAVSRCWHPPHTTHRTRITQAEFYGTVWWLTRRSTEPGLAGGREKSFLTQKESSWDIDAWKNHGLGCVAVLVQRRGTVSQPHPSPERIGEGDEGQRDDVVEEHDHRVLAPRVHVDGGVDGVPVEAALQQVGDGDVRGHVHALLPA